VIYYGESCSGSPTFCDGCPLGSSGCSWQANSKIYAGGTETVCSGGCDGECSIAVTVCYTEYPCIPMGLPMPLSYCSTYCLDSEGIPFPCDPHCDQSYPPFTCDQCIGDDLNPLKHTTFNDFCAGGY
jgi:hypothetical protein